ncbi:membrane protein insertion efficiency factor YidD [Flavobacterium sedimenticola]|uniref:Putative membrane protein insertion efficiency factor n=1 Tax=Flavobacterium sedimenticola TaxID=3043286 RepID=A0ABT6XSX3_9FLAO|nr:membrane protein insertion efficiency factor YidD [Flavobacterium sedimenticola]MDI9258209.1 membrane protein insertion efficiency factor YidD [Flavobacterium sedimenticola]
MLKKIAIAPLLLVIWFYKIVLSPLWPATCRFQPTCSTYFIEALKVHGLFYGSYLGIRRIARCHPWGKSGYDPVPDKKCSH